MDLPTGETSYIVHMTKNEVDHKLWGVYQEGAEKGGEGLSSTVLPCPFN